MTIRDWPLGERPREKLLHSGPHALSDAELLAIFLRTGTRGKTAVDVARDLLRQFGSIRNLLNADLKTFSQGNGLGEAKFVLLQATLEMGRRHLREVLERGSALTSPEETKAYLKVHMRDFEHEVFVCLFLDNRHRLISIEEMFRGTIDGASVYPREVVKRALALNAAAVIFAHNHPSGVAEPSQADELITAKLIRALRTVDIRVLDHFIVGDGSLCSFAERGLLDSV